MSQILWFAVIAGTVSALTSWYVFDRLRAYLANQQAKLEESSARIQAVVDNAADGIIVLDEQGNIESFNPAALEMFGYQADPVGKINLRNLIARGVGEETGDELTYFLVTPKATIHPCHQEIIGRRQDGSTFPMELVISVSRVSADDGSVETDRGATAGKPFFVAICRDITQRLLSAETVRNQAQLLDLANDSIIVLDLEGKITYWNQGAKRLYGWRRKEALGQNADALLNTQFPQPFAEIKEVLLQEGHWEGEVVQSKQDGSNVFVATSWSVQRNQEGQPVAILKINNDITKRKIAEAASFEATRMLQLAIDNIPQFILWKDCNGRIEGCNRNVAQLLGFENPADLVGKTDYDLPIEIEQVERYRAWDLRVMETNKAEYGIVEPFFLRHRGRRMWVEVNKIPLTGGDGEVVGILSTFDDITEHRAAQVAIAASEQRFRATFEQAAVGMAQTTLEGRWLLVNRKLCEILGYREEELLEKTFQDILHSLADLEWLDELLAGERETYSQEVSYVRSCGTPVWIDITVSRLREQEVRELLMWVVEDITFRKEAEESLLTRAEELQRTTGILAKTTAVLRKRNEELDQFAYVVSHDLKAPLRAIANLSTWIEEDLSAHLTEETRHQMDLLRGRVHRMEALIEGLLQYSRVGRIKIPSETVNVSKLLANILDSLALYSGDVHVEIEPEMPILLTQRLPLQQVFANLISNAIKHNHRSPGHVKISVKDLGDFYEFAVTDDGPGIAPQYHEKIFIIFSTLEARDKVENTGIGLSLVKKIVETKGGTIQVDSQEGQGANFRFTWPKVESISN